MPTLLDDCPLHADQLDATFAANVLKRKYTPPHKPHPDQESVTRDYDDANRIFERHKGLVGKFIHQYARRLPSPSYVADLKSELLQKLWLMSLAWDPAIARESTHYYLALQRHAARFAMIANRHGGTNTGDTAAGYSAIQTYTAGLGQSPDTDDLTGTILATAAARDDTLAAVERNERNRAVRAAIRSLPNQQRQIVSMHFRDSVTLAAIAKHLGIGAAAVSEELQRAKDSMRTKLAGVV